MEDLHGMTEFDELMDLIVSLKPLMHDLNHWFFSKRKAGSIAEDILEAIWLLVHRMRSERFITDKSFSWQALNQVAMQSHKMNTTLNEKEIPAKLLEQQFMELRQYVEKLEKSVVRQKYYIDTGRVATQIGTIAWAAKVSQKSEITIRRHIVEKKIWAFQITKFWWIPMEEIRAVHNGGELTMGHEATDEQIDLGNSAQGKEKVGIRTKEGVISFRLKVNCKIELTSENVKEIDEQAGRWPKDNLVIEQGLMIRYTLDQKQKEDILNAVAAVTKNDYAYCLANNVIEIHKHVRDDYLRDRPSKLSERGWSEQETELLKEMTHIICNLIAVDKATVKFHPTGDSMRSLSYTVIGEYGGFRAKLAFNFDTIPDDNGDDKEIMLIVTILDRKPIM